MVSFEQSTLYLVPIFLLGYIVTLSLLFKLPATPVSQNHSMENVLFHPEDKIVKPFADSLLSLCNQTIWQPGLYLNCTNIIHRPTRFEDHGDNWGTFNLRSMLTSCIRWAIDSGMGLIMPRIAIRSDYDLEYFPRWNNISFLFDEDNFKKTLNEQCPQLVIKDTYTEVKNIIKAPMPTMSTYYSVGLHRRRTNDLLRAGNITLDTARITVIWENKPLFGWVFSKDGINIHNTLLKAVEFRGDLIEMGKTLITFIKEPFIGLHLRAERDVIWYTYEELRDWCLEYVRTQSTHLKTIFISVGDLDIEKRFIEEMKAEKLTVISKWMLYEKLDPSLQQRMLDMQFDQLAVLDYEILKSSEVFLGVGESSFSYAVAFDRGNGILDDCKCSIRGSFGSGFRCCY
jgi:GDP-fucose protein O-fucosyltransferase